MLTYNSRCSHSICSCRPGCESCSVEHLVQPRSALAHAGIGRICHSHSCHQDASDYTSSSQFVSYDLRGTQWLPGHAAVVPRLVFPRFCCNRHTPSFWLSLRLVRWRHYRWWRRSCRQWLLPVSANRGKQAPTAGRQDLGRRPMLISAVHSLAWSV
jgi:hypothetical protein